MTLGGPSGQTHFVVRERGGPLLFLTALGIGILVGLLAIELPPSVSPCK